MLAHRRHDISEKLWKLLEPNLPGSKGSVGSPPLLITACSSTQYFGYYAPERRGGIYHQTSVIGKMYNVDFADGVTVEYGKNYWKCALMNRIMSG